MYQAIVRESDATRFVIELTIQLYNEAQLKRKKEETSRIATWQQADERGLKDARWPQALYI